MVRVPLIPKNGSGCHYGFGIANLCRKVLYRRTYNQMCRYALYILYSNPDSRASSFASFEGGSNPTTKSLILTPNP